MTFDTKVPVEESKIAHVASQYIGKSPSSPRAPFPGTLPRANLDWFHPRGWSRGPCQASLYGRSENRARSSTLLKIILTSSSAMGGPVVDVLDEDSVQVFGLKGDRRPTPTYQERERYEYLGGGLSQEDEF